jgi:hypothetical protein
MKQYLLTTVDNPYHPIDQYDDWRQFDMEHGYYTEQRLAKVAATSYSLTDLENQRNINAAVDDFIRLDELGLYKRIVVED